VAGPVVVTSRVVVVVTVVGSPAQPTSAHVANTNRDGVALLICFFGVMILPFLPRYSNFGWRVRKGTKNLAGKSPPPDSDPFSDGEFEKISPSCQTNSPHGEILSDDFATTSRPESTLYYGNVGPSSPTTCSAS
jgi:hypothetical protein